MMKTKLNVRICIVLLLALCSLPTMAQRNDPEAAVKALTKVIKKWHVKPEVLDAAVEDICSKYKKNPYVYNGAAEAFWWNGADSARTMKYANKAIAIDGKYAAAYVLQGDMWAYYKDTVKAKTWYEKAMTANPQSPLGFEACAKLREKSGDPDGAVAMLEKIATANPDYPFHLKAARIYERNMEEKASVGKYLTTAIGHYEQVEPDSMECYDVVNYATLYYGMHDYDKCLAILEPYMSKFASDSYFNNLCLQTTVEAEQFAKAEQFATNFLSTTPDSIRKSQHYKYCVRTYLGLKKYEEAIEVSKKWMGLSIAKDEDKEYAIGKIADAYKELGEFEKAEDAYAEYIESREKTDKLTPDDINALAKLYMDKANESNGSEKIAAYMKADSIYDVMANKFLQYADKALYNRYRISVYIHPNPKDGNALPVCRRLISTLLAKKDLDDTNKERLVEAYKYIAWNNLENKNYKRSKEYFLKMLSIDPNNTDAQKALNVLKKY